MTSEQDFLKNYSMEKYERPSVTTDIVAFMIRTEDSESYRHDPKSSLSVLLVKRGKHPFLNCWAIPGGFLHSTETIEECALREITEETNVTPAALMPLGTFSEIGRDPRGWVISNAFVSIISEEDVKAVGGDDAADAKWFDITFEPDGNGLFQLTLQNETDTLRAVVKEKSRKFGRTEYEIVDSGNLAFDHAKIIATALTSLRESANDFDIIFDFLPETFTLTALQKVQETITNIAVLPANFRRKVANYVVETDEYITGSGHRPAKLFKRK